MCLLSHNTAIRGNNYSNKGIIPYRPCLWSILGCLLIALITGFFLFCFPPESLALTVGGEEIEGYTPSDLIQSDIEINVPPDQIAGKLEQLVIVFIKAILPIVLIASVCIIVFNAIANIFRKEDKKVKITGIIKNMAQCFFWILFSWLIVELIVFGITSGETFLYGLLINQLG